MKNFLLALLTGLLVTFAWPVGGWAFLLFFAFVPLLFVEYDIRMSKGRRKKWKIFGLSYLSFFIWNLLTTYWLLFSTIFGGVIAIVFNSLFMALVFLLYHIVAKRTTFRAGSAFLICFWICFEFLHLKWEFSWPWLNLGNGFSEAIYWVQWYEFTGTFGGTLWVWLVNFGIFTTLLLYREHRVKEIIYRGLVKNSLLIIIPAVISVILWNTHGESKKSLEAVVLQPNINPYTEKYNTSDVRIGALLTGLAEQSVTPDTRIVIAPETVFADGTPLTDFQNSQAYFFTSEFVKEHPATSFLSGVSMYDRFSDPLKVSPQSNRIGPMDW
ncbi:MAG TPA: apolipoprotein N-acyltransferase, partial [Salinimicrobium sp.]|nr:apolipoprotein N-acyltransferase [Salinimicrobium sp.]